MKICKVCKIENEDQFMYCKNCGTQFEVPVPVVSVPLSKPEESESFSQNGQDTASPAAPVQETKMPEGLVPVAIVLPDPNYPDYRIPQTVYVTPAQKSAIEYAARKQAGQIR